MAEGSRMKVNLDKLRPKQDVKDPIGEAMAVSPTSAEETLSKGAQARRELRETLARALGVSESSVIDVRNTIRTRLKEGRIAERTTEEIRTELAQNREMISLIKEFVDAGNPPSEISGLIEEYLSQQSAAEDPNKRT